MLNPPSFSNCAGAINHHFKLSLRKVIRNYFESPNFIAERKFLMMSMTKNSIEGSVRSRPLRLSREFLSGEILFPITLLFFVLNISMISSNTPDAAVAQDFPSVTIGNQTWMTVNWDNYTPKSWYFDNDSINNKKYGRLYYFSNALAAAPPGWHLPSLDEWQTLINHFGGDDKALANLLTGGSSGLNLLFGGNKSANISPTAIFNFKDTWGFYWTSTTDADQTAYAIHFEKGSGKITKTTYRRANGFSVRYVKDK